MPYRHCLATVLYILLGMLQSVDGLQAPSKMYKALKWVQCTNQVGPKREIVVKFAELVWGHSQHLLSHSFNNLYMW